MAEVLEADLTWLGGAFVPGVRVAVDAAGGIAAVGRLEGAAVRRLARRAMVPGLVNAHSHAFQRALRGRGESFPDGAGSFWSWRRAMYELVAELDADGLFEISRQAFREMLGAGITTVGEFHYLHHSPGTEDYALDRVVLAAAAEAGIRIVLLVAAYQTGGPGRPLAGPQGRFATPDLDAFWSNVDALASEQDPPTQSVGAAGHSVRALAPPVLAALRAEAARRGMVFHMHVAEQRREVEECLAAYGRHPLRVAIDDLAVDHTFTAVHCTHSPAPDMTPFAEAGGRVCLCPLTEGNLGDGLPNLAPAMAPGVGGALCLGTDSNARIAMAEEMRWLEYGQRLAGETRGAIVGPDGDTATRLLGIATAGGADSLGVEAGAIAPGRWADFLLLDLDAPALAGASADTLAAAWVFGGGNEAVAATCVGGRWSPAGTG